MADYANTYKNDLFLKAYEKDRKGGEELGFLRVFTTTSLFQRLTFRDKFHEDEDDIRLFKKYAKAEATGGRFDLEKFADDKKCPVFDCLPFFDLLYISHEDWKEWKKMQPPDPKEHWAAQKERSSRQTDAAT